MNLTLIIRGLNIVAGVFMIIGGVMTILAFSFPNIIQGVFVILFGVMTLLFEFKLHPKITQFASFMFSFLGRGLFYIFIGAITLSYGGLGLASGIIVLIVGAIFVVAQFTKIESPSNMQKRAYEDAVGYSQNIPDNSPPHFGGQGFSQDNNGMPQQYPTANYANSGAV